MTYSVLSAPQEKKIRSSWLKVSLLSVGVQCISAFINWIFPLANASYQMNPFFLLVGPIFSLSMMILLYFFSYRNHGTKLLTAFLVWIFIGTVFIWGKLLIVAITGAAKIGNIEFDGVFGLLGLDNFWRLVVFPFATGISIWWFVLSLKLRKVNKTIKKLPDPLAQFKDVLTKIRTIVNLEDLDTTFHEAVARLPQFEPALSKEYGIRKDVLLSSSIT